MVIETSALEFNSSMIFTPSVTSESVIGEAEKVSKTDAHSDFGEPSIPWPGFQYIIRSVSTGKVITFRGGKIILGPMSNYSAICWRLEVSLGFLRLRDPASYMYLCYANGEELVCGPESLGYESTDFTIRHRPDGKYVILATMDRDTDEPELLPLGIETKNGVERPAILVDWDSDSIGWEFIKIKANDESTDATVSAMSCLSIL